MRKRIVGAGIAICLFILAVSSYAIDLAGSGNNSTSMNNTSTTLNATNSSLDTINDSIDSILAESNNQSGLWSWGDVPAGYTRKNGKIVPESILDSDASVMETPSELSPNNDNIDPRTGGLLVRPE